MFGPGSSRDSGVISQQAIIANGESLSAEIDLNGYALLAIQMPASWTAANLIFQASIDDGVTFNDIYDWDGTEVNIPAACCRVILVNPQLGYSFDRIKIRSGTSGIPVNQGASRTLKLLLRVL